MMALPTNIILGCKSLPGTNTLAYNENPLIAAVKSSIVQAPVVSKFALNFRYEIDMLNSIKFNLFISQHRFIFYLK
jgi:hypothetical protein